MWNLSGQTLPGSFGEVRNRYYEPFRSTVDISHPRTYYSILVMDGDDMGQWLSGTGPVFRSTWNSGVSSDD